MNTNKVKTMKTHLEILLNTSNDLVRDLKTLKEEIKTKKTIIIKKIIKKINDNEIYPNLKKYFNIIYPNLLTFEEGLVYRRLMQTNDDSLIISNPKQYSSIFLKPGNLEKLKNQEISVGSYGGKKTRRQRKQKNTKRNHKTTNRKTRRFRKTRKY